MAISIPPCFDFQSCRSENLLILEEDSRGREIFRKPGHTETDDVVIRVKDKFEHFSFISRMLWVLNVTILSSCNQRLVWWFVLN